MNKPEDIPQGIWDVALASAETVLRNLPDDYGDVSFEIATIARAILSAEKRGEEREREGAATEVGGMSDALYEKADAAGVDGRDDAFAAWIASNIAAAIRKRSSDVNTTHKISEES